MIDTPKLLALLLPAQMRRPTGVALLLLTVARHRRSCGHDAFGKTVVAASLIARRGVNTLVLVHRRQLLDQWVDRLETFLDLPAKSIGRIGGGRHMPTGIVDVAVIQSLVRKGVVDDRVAHYGHLIVDECHYLSAHSFEQVARQAKPRFVLGLSATVARKDGHHPIIFMQCGPIGHRVNARVQAASRPFEHFALVRPTSFRPAKEPESDKPLEFQSSASAIQGWPADVVLPSDPAWKRDYSGSVQRLVRDGVDTPLASFVRPRGSLCSGGCGRRRSGQKCHGGVPLQAAGAIIRTLAHRGSSLPQRNF